LPDPVLEVPADERSSRTWGSDPLLQVQGVGAFVRVMLPIRLTDGHSLTFGTWLAINPSELPSVWERWETDTYPSIVLEGYLANAIAPWGRSVFGAPATATVREPTQNPYITATTQTALAEVIEREWPYREVLEANGVSGDIHQH
jgi:hypothetical protein